MSTTRTDSTGTLRSTDGGSHAEDRANAQGDDTLVGITNRSIYFTRRGLASGQATTGSSYEAGTEVYVTGLRDGWVSVRIPGTLLEQRVTFASVEPA